MPALQHGCLESITVSGAFYGFVSRLGGIIGKSRVMNFDIENEDVCNNEAPPNLKEAVYEYLDMVSNVISSPHGALKTLDIDLPELPLHDITFFMNQWMRKNALPVYTQEGEKLDELRFRYAPDVEMHEHRYVTCMSPLLRFLQMVAPAVRKMGLGCNVIMDVAVLLNLTPLSPEAITVDPGKTDVVEELFDDEPTFDNIKILRNDVLFWGQVLSELRGSGTNPLLGNRVFVGVRKDRFENPDLSEIVSHHAYGIAAIFNVFLRMLQEIGQELLTYPFITRQLDTVIKPSGVDSSAVMFALDNLGNTNLFSTLVTSRMVELFSPTTAYNS
mmetsp:Transcript_21758/g.42799  ORF Transcript_21758/g.42799 Transcript_21758/m.42799 type:complete len:330 (+) Transcript_21758:299-1288(+)|eukprot:CAMPEP_0171516332 /NCGR_PEP_ID=MMETSP0959-20130129/3976_1 /TAXON_ID=87120 /ORGANISM="Aurantiochytrium limacinum, Strain ATCCMYA-1381" /LENGTH=329 /DNA_ID=CAMNT_0012055027 /DNA_START=208 /DNA_END=1197 /DNA_ORIENTATION=-